MAAALEFCGCVEVWWGLWFFGWVVTVTTVCKLLSGCKLHAWDAPAPHCVTLAFGSQDGTTAKHGDTGLR